jgi:transglutaminase-like putative cysteine protease
MGPIIETVFVRVLTTQVSAMKRLLHWLRGEEGWSTLGLLTLVALLPVIAFGDAHWLSLSNADLSKTAIIGAWAGMILGRSRLRGLIAMPLGILIGGAAVFLTVGGATPAIGSILQRLGPFWEWVQLVRAGKPYGPDPLSPLFREAAGQAGFLVNRFSAWFSTIVAGGASSDNLVFLLQVAVLVWIAAFVAGWGLYHSHDPLLATLPCGAFVLVNAFLADQGWGYVCTYLISVLILTATLNMFRLKQSWEAHALDYADELSFDVGLASTVLVAALVLLTLPLPGLTSNPVARAWWNTVSEPWSEVEASVNRMFSGINNPNQALGAGARGALVLGGSFDPRQDTPVFMYITTDEQLPDLRDFREMGVEPVAPSHYWRGSTFDTYTGRSWVNSERADLDRAPGQEVLPNNSANSTGPVNPTGFVSITQLVELVPPRVDLVYAVNQPFTVSTAYRVQALGGEDFSSLSLRDLSIGAIQYSVRSFMPRLGETDLRATPTLYPDWVAKRYLALPASLPKRVTDLAMQLTAGVQTPYDKALAIQDYLRKLPYDPKILLPSGDFDAVDYFLFLQKGYCDYFGTTMAVLLRAGGVPARVARGYLPGEYDWTNHRYVVRENRLHTWTEVYFPPYGWIEFEPTPAQPPITRPPGSLLLEPSTTPPPLSPATPSPPGQWEAVGDMGHAVLLLLGASALALLVWALYPVWEQRLSASRYSELIYQRMARYASWGGRPRRVSQSPTEYAAALSEDLAGRRGGFRLGPWTAGSSAPSAQDAERVRTIADGYEAAAYGRQPVDEPQRERVHKAWVRVKGRFWSLALTRGKDVRRK